MAILSATAVSDCYSQFCLNYDMFSNPVEEMVHTVCCRGSRARSEASICRSLEGWPYDQAGSISACDSEDSRSNVYQLVKLQAANLNERIISHDAYAMDERVNPYSL